MRSRVRVAELQAVAAGVAKRAASYDERRAAADWHSWLREGPGQGLGRQHRISRVATGWVPTPVEMVAPDSAGHAEELLQQRDTLPLHAQAQVDAEARKWAKEWACDEADQIPPIVWPNSVPDDLPALTVGKLRDAARTFSTTTGLGWDQIHPRFLLRCPDELVEMLVQVLLGCAAPIRIVR